MALLAAAQNECRTQTRALMAEEDVPRGVCHAARIYELTQCRNMLETHREFRRVRINRLQRH